MALQSRSVLVARGALLLGVALLVVAGVRAVGLVTTGRPLGAWLWLSLVGAVGLGFLGVGSFVIAFE